MRAPSVVHCPYDLMRQAVESGHECLPRAAGVLMLTCSDVSTISDRIGYTATYTRTCCDSVAR